jgi:hypothetical protein
VKGKKANYKIEIPVNFIANDAIGKNIDLKYININDGSSIITLIELLPDYINEEDIPELNKVSEHEIKNSLESAGLLNIKILKKGMIYINGKNSFYKISTCNNETYTYTITQFKNRKDVSLTFTCGVDRVSYYLPILYRVIHSLEYY